MDCSKAYDGKSRDIAAALSIATFSHALLRHKLVATCCRVRVFQHAAGS
jgi:hypothetical protein